KVRAFRAAALRGWCGGPGWTTVAASAPAGACSEPAPRAGTTDLGEVSEWLKEHAWKVCIRKRIEGSNPSLTATNKFRRNSHPESGEGWGENPPFDKR